ncbi:hypothetical protein [Maribellus sp. YY47]|uniref:hypothetical protein n=1 Tax=Maribellus sp. YY47 TaxID=2929486 RepID=UPI0020007C62|nr:hypothetical protein [Maribellus sp. YY47]MCK3684749.1 hypothetical protein [Maribellus sp. YY47]
MKTLKIIISTIALALVFGGCAYNFIVPEPTVNPDDPNAAEVSFSAEIVPIFASKCTGCHTTGKQLPDLTSDNAFSSLNSSRYVNKSTPASSLIYTKATGNHSATFTSAEAAKVLLWINQGAKNN